MNTLLGPVDSFARTAAEALLNSIWQSAVLAFSVWLLLLLFKRAGAAAKYGVWAAALLAVVCLTFLNALTSRSATPAKDETAPGGRAEISRSRTSTDPGTLQPPVAASADATVGDGAAAVSVEAEGASSYGVPETARESPPPPRESFSVRLRGGRWPQLFLMLWVLGSSLMLVRLVRGYLFLRRVRRESLPLADYYQRRMRYWTKTCGIRRTVSLRGSARITAPLMLGLRETAILFPETLADRLAEDEFDQVLLHELAHVRRRDDWGNLAQKLAEAVFFFHPVVWWVGRQLGAERECACDQWVVSVTGAHRSYASCLTKLFELTRTPDVALWAPGATPVRSHLARRVETILKCKPRRPARLSAVGFFLPLCVLLTGVIQLGRLSPVIAVSAEGISAAESAGLRAPSGAARPEQLRPDNAGVSGWLEYLAGEAGRARLHEEGAATRQTTPAGPTASASVGVPASRADSTRSLPWPVIAVAAEDTGPPAALPVAHVLPAGGARPEVSGGPASPRLDAAPGTQERNASPATPPSDESRLPEDFFKTVAALGNPGSQREILSALVRRPGLNKETLIRALLASKHIDSDGEKAEFLVGAARVCACQPDVLDAFFEAVSTINSAGERRRVLAGLLSSQPGDREVLYRTLKAAAAVNSDGEKAELLVKAASLYAVDQRALSAFLGAVASIDSSAEQRRALTALLRQSGLSKEAVIQTVRFARRISSDGEKAEFLTRVAEVCRVDGGVLDAYLATASSINSSAEQARALAAIAKRRETGRGAPTQTGATGD